MDGLQKDTLFLACTRPAMFWGVPFEGFMLNFCLSFLLGLWLGSPVYWLVGVVIHFPMRILASMDHNFFRVWRLWLETKGSAVGSDLWGGSALAAMPARQRRRPSEEPGSV
jgi:type IV secretion system protein VirB3